MKFPAFHLLPLSLVLFSAAACSSQGDETGDARVSVFLESEDVIVDGLSAGTGPADILDGWSVTFDKYLVAVGDVVLTSSSDTSVSPSAHEIYVVDLAQLGPASDPLWSLENLPEGEFEFAYSTTIDDAIRQDGVSEDDFELMMEREVSYLVSGRLEQAGGTSCPPLALAQPPEGAEVLFENEAGDSCYEAEAVRFSFGLDAEVAYGPCEIDGLPGVSTTSGGSTTVAITIHGDHLFFNGFPEGAEGGVARYAQWLADCDLNLDGEVTEEELGAIAPSDLSELDGRFQLGGSPLTPLDNMMTYLTAQAMTQGHFQGEGECAAGGHVHEH